MKNTNVILFPPGGYGHFLNWCCDYFSGKLDNNHFPINNVGNFHRYKANSTWRQPKDFVEYTESKKEDRFIIIHECQITNTIGLENNSIIWKNVVEQSLEYLDKNYKKILYIHSTDTSHYWLANNEFYKMIIDDSLVELDKKLSKKEFIEFLIQEHNFVPLQAEFYAYSGNDLIKRLICLQDDIEQNLKKWGYSSIDDLELWQLREFASIYLADKINETLMDKNFVSEIQQRYPKIKFIRLDDLRDNFKETIKSILDYFNIDIVNWQKIEWVHQNWLIKQQHINKDQNINKIVEALINKTSLDWKNWNLSFLDEFLIQKKLADNNILIKCFKLNDFPTNTEEFLSLLEEK
jgi:hypothetical protein